MPTTALLLPFVLVSFAANSLITRYVVAEDLLDPGLLTAVRFVAAAVALLALALVRRERCGRAGGRCGPRCGWGCTRCASPTATCTSGPPRARSCSTLRCC